MRTPRQPAVPCTVGHDLDLRRHLGQPLGLYRGDVVHVLLRRQNEFMVYAPFRCAIEERRAGMKVYGSSLNQRLVTFRGVLLRRITEKSGADGHSNTIVIVATGDNIVLVPVHDAEELLTDILSSTHAAALNVILWRGRFSTNPKLSTSSRLTHFETPRTGELACLPTVIHRQQRE